MQRRRGRYLCVLLPEASAHQERRAVEQPLEGERKRLELVRAEGAIQAMSSEIAQAGRAQAQQNQMVAAGIRQYKSDSGMGRLRATQGAQTVVA